MGELKFLITIFCALNVVNIIVSIFLYLNIKDRLFKYMGFFWVANLFNFLSQGIFENNHLFLSYGVGIYFFSNFFLVKIIMNSLELDYKYQKEFYVLMVSYAISTLLYKSHFGFEVYSIPIVFALTLPVFRSLYCIYKNKDRVAIYKIQKVFLIFLTINAFHFWDYPFLRLNEVFAPFGFAIAFVFLFLFSILTPTLILDKLSKYNRKELELRVVERTEALTKANEKLEEEKHLKNTLLSLLSHDLSNQLMMIHLFLNRSSSKSKFHSKILKLIKQAILNLNNVKMLRSIENNSYNLELQDISCDEIFEHLKPILEFYELQNNVKFKINNKVLPNVLFQADLFSLVNNVLSNLLSNSAKFTPKDMEIVISAEERGGHVVISVEDKGPGVPEEVKKYLLGLETEKIVSKDSCSGKKGTGLGLSLVKHFIKQYNAYMEIDNVEAGSIFKIYFEKLGQK